MSANEPHASADALQFDTAETSEQRAEGDAAAAGVVCAVCRRSIDTEYYHVNGTPVCGSCRHTVSEAAETPRGSRPLLRAGLFGVGAAIAGAAIYYAVIAITELEIGLVAILIGYMVGCGVRKGAKGRGGRRFQILAAVLTYWSVGLAYTPLGFKGISEQGGQAASGADSARVAAAVTDSATPSLAATDGARAVTPGDSGSATAQSRKITARDFFIALAMLLVFVFALPVIAVISSLPSGLISALIIFIGLRQAWQMTAAAKLEISGPYKVGASPSAAAA